MKVINETGDEVSLRTFEGASLPADRPWEHSINAYNISVLQSLGILNIHVSGEDGVPAPSSGLAPWVMPVLMSRRISPGEAADFHFDINELFQISSPGGYRVGARYSDGEFVAEAAVAIEIDRGGGS